MTSPVKPSVTELDIPGGWAEHVLSIERHTFQLVAPAEPDRLLDHLDQFDLPTNDPDRERLLDDWLAQHIPGFLGPKVYTKTCLYTMPKDRDFVIDHHPEHPQIIICNGAGHAYKFAGLLGKILSELAIDGQTDHPVEPFTLDRPAITDPDFPAQFHI